MGVGLGFSQVGLSKVISKGWLLDSWRSELAGAVLVFPGGLPRGTVVKNLPVNAGDARDRGCIPGWGRSPEVGNGNPLQYSCLKNSVNRGVWGGKTVHGVEKSQV